MNSQTEKIQLKGAAGAIEVLRDAAAAGAPALGVAVIAHPHPLFGGTMDNKVVQTLARAFVACGWTAVRFNFRGVGASEGVHDEGRGETRGHAGGGRSRLAPEGPLAHRRLFVRRLRGEPRACRRCGPSATSGTWCWSAPPPRASAVAPLPPDAHERTLVVHGEHDDTVPLAAVMDWARPQSLPVTVVPGGGHFFHGQLPLLKNLVVRHLRAG